MKHPIPSAALDDRLGFIGTSGSGKTYNAGTAVEILLSQRKRVVTIDPLGVWWGLRLLADGKKPSNFNVVIFGGPHGDLPLTDVAGALIGETAATMAESCIVDLSELKTKAAERRFMVAFLDAIYRKAGGEPFHLIVDEADLFAPQKPADGDQMLLAKMEEIVRRGRIKGFIPWLISQRPAVLNKNVLSQIDGMLAFKLTGSHDRDALDSWIEGQADKAQGKAIKDSLPALQIGQGVVWIPGRGVLEPLAKFPPKATFDSSRTPKRGEKAKRTAKLKPIDIGKLKDKLATVEAEVKASDPKALRAELEAAKRELTKLQAKPATAAPAADPAAIAKAEERGFDRGKKAVKAEATKQVKQERLQLLSEISDLFGPVMKSIDGKIKELKSAKPDVAGAVTFAASAPAPRQAPARPVSRASSPPQADGTLTNPQRELLRSLAWWCAMGHAEVSRPQVAAIAGWTPSGSNLRNRLSELNTFGLVAYPRAGFVSLTETGIAAAPAPDVSQTLIDSIRAILTVPQRTLFDALPGDGGEVHRADLAAAVGWEPNGSNLRNRLSELRTLEIVTYPQKGTVAVQAWVRSA
jgi:hypothetical protein